MKELGLKGNQARVPNTYETCTDKTTNQLINSHCMNILTHFNISFNTKTNIYHQFTDWALSKHRMTSLEQVLNIPLRYSFYIDSYPNKMKTI